VINATFNKGTDECGGRSPTKQSQSASSNQRQEHTFDGPYSSLW
jgi:hypothetical protein